MDFGIVESDTGRIWVCLDITLEEAKETAAMWRSRFGIECRAIRLTPSESALGYACLGDDRD